MQCSLTLTRAARPQQHALARRGRRRARPLSTATMEPRDPASECQSIINREKLLVRALLRCVIVRVVVARHRTRRRVLLS
jgi:hypothetical protein